jgi:hypothetical protein
LKSNLLVGKRGEKTAGSGKVLVNGRIFAEVSRFERNPRPGRQPQNPRQHNSTIPKARATA